MGKIDLTKYDLSHLENISIISWTDTDIDKLIDAFINEKIAPTINGLDFTQHNVERLLATSYCRNCGWCCKSYSFGTIVTERDLKLISKHSNFSYKSLKKKVIKRKNPAGEEQRCLPQPCMFYKNGRCTIYDIRPFSCRIYPITNDLISGGKSYISIILGCDYGRDIYKNQINRMKEDAIEAFSM